MKIARLAALALSVSLLTFPVLAQSTIADAPRAEVTFYTIGLVRSDLPGYNRESFTGPIFDDDHLLAHMEPGRFVTFTLEPGTHAFAAYARTGKHPVGHRLTLDLIANNHYFVAIYFNNHHLIVPKITIEGTACEAARKDARNPKPLEGKYIDQASLPLAVHETSFPACL